MIISNNSIDIIVLDIRLYSNRFNRRKTIPYNNLTSLSSKRVLQGFEIIDRAENLLCFD